MLVGYRKVACSVVYISLYVNANKYRLLIKTNARQIYFSFFMISNDGKFHRLQPKNSCFECCRTNEIEKSLFNCILDKLV